MASDSTNQYVLVEFGSQCEAEANNGFQFNSWTEILGHNSSKTITRSEISNSPFDFLFGSHNRATAFKVSSQLGNFTSFYQ
jgi:hypothetical protein